MQHAKKKGIPNFLKSKKGLQILHQTNFHGFLAWMKLLDVNPTPGQDLAKLLDQMWEAVQGLQPCEPVAPVIAAAGKEDLRLRGRLRGLIRSAQEVVKRFPSLASSKNNLDAACEWTARLPCHAVVGAVRTCKSLQSLLTFLVISIKGRKWKESVHQHAAAVSSPSCWPHRTRIENNLHFPQLEPEGTPLYCPACQRKLGDSTPTHTSRRKGETESHPYETSALPSNHHGCQLLHWSAG